MTQVHEEIEPLRRTLQSFAGLLEEESNLLAENRIEDLPDLVARKQALAESTSTAWTQCVAWLRHQSADGLDRRPVIPADIMPAWQAIVSLARRVESLNQRNGQLIDAHLRRTKGALDVLMSASKPVHLYGADGQMLNLPGQGTSLDQV